MDKIIACSTIKPEIEALDPAMECQFMEYGLHRTPDKLNNTLQEAIDESEEEGFRTIRLGYGLCSHGTSGLNAEKATLIIPRAHDCISILLGSAEDYMKEFKSSPGTIYLSRGWIEFEGDPLSEYKNYVEVVGEEMARETIEMEYRNYTRLVFINTWLADEKLEEYRERARKIADFVNLEYMEEEGSPKLLKKLLAGKEDPELGHFPPGRIILRSNLV